MHQKCPVAAVGALVPGPNGQLVVSSSITRPQPTTPSGSGDFKALVVATPGLQNQIGEYNCFLNVIIQSLWNCRHFRAPFKAASAAFSSPQVCPAALLLGVWVGRWIPDSLLGIRQVLLSVLIFNRSLLPIHS